jgi:hypothetical protein
VANDGLSLSGDQYQDHDGSASPLAGEQYSRPRIGDSLDKEIDAVAKAPKQRSRLDQEIDDVSRSMSKPRPMSRPPVFK